MHEVRVLLVDDDEGFLEAMEELLTSSGLAVEPTTDAAEAIDLIQTHAFDAAVLDLSLHGSANRDGLSILRSLKTKDGGTPVLLISAYLDEASRAEAQRLGADAVLEKPVSGRKVVATLAQLTEERQP